MSFLCVGYKTKKICLNKNESSFIQPNSKTNLKMKEDFYGKLL